MRNNPSEELNNRLTDLRDVLSEFLELTQILEQVAEEFVSLEIDPSTSDILIDLRQLIPELYQNYQAFYAEISQYQTELSSQRFWSAEEIDDAYTAINEGIIRLRQSVDQLAIVTQTQCQTIIETRLAQLSELIFTLENNTEIARTQLDRLRPDHPQFAELSELIALLEVDCLECRQAFDRYVLIADQVSFTLENTVELFEELQAFTAVVEASVELAQTICLDLLN